MDRFAAQSQQTYRKHEEPAQPASLTRWCGQSDRIQAQAGGYKLWEFCHTADVHVVHDYY